MDASEILLPYGKEGARLPIERLRDLMRMWAAMEDGQMVYILFGNEFQTRIHYAMPVRDMTYTGINYSAQADEARRSYKKDKGAITTDGDEVRIKLTREEFLSGFRRTDKLIPTISTMVFPWCREVGWSDHASRDAEHKERTYFESYPCFYLCSVITLTICHFCYIVTKSAGNYWR